MTKVTKLHEPQAEKKKIEFHHAIDKNFNKSKLSAKPEHYEIVSLLVPKYMGNFDLMLAISLDYKHLFIGHFNEGIV